MVPFVHVKKSPFELLEWLAYDEGKENNLIVVKLIPMFLFKREKDKLAKWYDNPPWESNLDIVTIFIKWRLASLNLICNRFPIAEIYKKLGRHNILFRSLNEEGLYIVARE